jgi:tRNA threonylcarbamoyl adenosine modification protein (Sua5/YciO/YrdC/YwlC family)
MIREAVPAGDGIVGAVNASTTLDCQADPEAAIAAATAAVRAGECIVLPTDTVYGIGANALDAAAVQRLLDAKERGRDMPSPVLIAEPSLLEALAADVGSEVQALADAFWPGALTLIVRSQHALRMDLGDRGDTIAVRVPDHDFTRSLLRRTGPLAVSSANVTGRDAALTIDDARDQLGDRISVYLDAGECSGPVPSTIIDVTRGGAIVLRDGRLTPDQLRAVVPGIEWPERDPEQEQPGSPEPETPGDRPSEPEQRSDPDRADSA